MAEYTGPATTNEAVVIAQMDGRKVPDIFGTGEGERDRHDHNLKFQSAHPKVIHNDVYRRYGNDELEGYEDC